MLRNPTHERFEVWLVLFVLYEILIALGHLALMGMLSFGIFFTWHAEQSSHGTAGSHWDMAPDFLTATINFAAIVVGLFSLLTRYRLTRLFWIAYLPCFILISMYYTSQNEVSYFLVVPLISVAWLAYWIWSPHVRRLFP